jgi:hypothetical protein
MSAPESLKRERELSASERELNSEVPGIVRARVRLHSRLPGIQFSLYGNTFPAVREYISCAPELPARACDQRRRRQAHVRPEKFNRSPTSISQRPRATELPSHAQELKCAGRELRAKGLEMDMRITHLLSHVRGIRLPTPRSEFAWRGKQFRSCCHEFHTCAAGSRTRRT